MDIVNPEIADYLSKLSRPEDKILKEMEILGRKLRYPIVGPMVGKILYQMALITKAKRIFEMGSGFGYSAYWFARGLPDEGEIILTDFSREMLQVAMGFFKKAQMAHKIRIEKGEALEIIDQYPGEFDIIFNDIEKHQYPAAFRKALPRLKKGGLLIADNVLWSGSVLTNMDTPDVLGIKEFNQLIFQSKELLTAIIPLRDGISLSVKI